MSLKPWKRRAGAAAPFLLAAALLLAAGCSDQSAASPASATEAGGEERIGIEFSASPEKPKVNEKASLKADVTRGGSPLSEAQVVFEIWPKGAGPESHAQLLAKPGENEGSYELKGEFAEKGIYYVITHITPEDTGQMTMASFEFEIQ